MSQTSYIIRLNESASDDDLKKAVEHFRNNGGEVTHQHTLFKGFSGTISADKVSTLDSIPGLAGIEKDGEVHTLK